MSEQDHILYQVCNFVRDTRKLTSIQALIEWDHQTYMPQAAGPYRAEQITFLAGAIHERQTDKRLGEWLDQLVESDAVKDAHSQSGATVLNLKRQFDKKTKLPQELVEALAQATSKGQQVWVEARREKNFSKLAAVLEEIFKLKRDEADAIGHDGCRYDALLDDYEPFAKTDEIRSALSQLRDELVVLIREIGESSVKPDMSILYRKFPIAAQKKLANFASSKIGFDYNRGRLDTTHHPFCTELGPSDCRITTRYDEDFFSGSFFGTLHEAGHGIYEQGLPEDQYGLPPGEYCSLGIHESQSRMWENLVGRSVGFWRFFFAETQKAFPNALKDVSLDEWYAAVNHVQPSLIRVEADQATYDLHIIIRFELEQMLLDEQLSVSDLPDAWNDKYENAMGVRPGNDADGVMQDIHWSAGLIGYFPTYSLGNIYSSQLFAKAEEELGDLNGQFSEGEFQPLFDWLRNNVHSHGNRYSSRELVEKVTGTPTTSTFLVNHLRERLAPIYKL